MTPSTSRSRSAEPHVKAPPILTVCDLEVAYGQTHGRIVAAGPTDTFERARMQQLMSV